MRLRLSRNSIVLGILSFIVVIYAEWIYPSKAFDMCDWPTAGPTAKHVAIIGDPQLVDGNTYPGRNWLFMWFTRVVADRYMARNYRLLHQRMQPDAIFFLGDLFDGGREWEDRPWKEEYRRFFQVFPESSTVKSFRNLPGNHDVGSVNDIIPSSFERFKSQFGNPNQVNTIGGHSFVTLDTNALMNTERETIYGPAREFFDSLKKDQEKYDPIIILTHIPLYRPEGSYCGFEREGKPLQWTKGTQYITEVDPDLTFDIVHGLKPSYIFSGDDHDICKYTHRWSKTEAAEEHTVKSFSLAMGISTPGLQLLSVDSRKRHDTDSCLLGKPFYPIFIQLGVYSSILVFELILVSYRTRKAKKEYVRVPTSEEHKRDGPSSQNHGLDHRATRDLISAIISLAVGWLIGQLVINDWSYKGLK